MLSVLCLSARYESFREKCRSMLRFAISRDDQINSTAQTSPPFSGQTMPVNGMYEYSNVLRLATAMIELTLQCLVLLLEGLRSSHCLLLLPSGGRSNLLKCFVFVTKLSFRSFHYTNFFGR